jgi:hypothetical protein
MVTVYIIPHQDTLIHFQSREYRQLFIVQFYLNSRARQALPVTVQFALAVSTVKAEEAERS